MPRCRGNLPYASLIDKGKSSSILLRGARFMACGLFVPLFLTENFPLSYHSHISYCYCRKLLVSCRQELSLIGSGGKGIATSVVNTSVAFRQSRHLALVKVLRVYGRQRWGSPARKRPICSNIFASIQYDSQCTAQ